jgi:SAM-dependent methyltransferase
LPALAEQRVGRTFGRVAEQYERARPEYPREAVERAEQELGLSGEATVLDLGAGTGKLTRLLAGRFARVIAVEPDDEMRRLVAGDTRAGTAEHIPLADGEVDAVFVADAFHWFDQAAALAEIARVVRPGGGLALLWNDWWEKEQPPMPAAAREILDCLFARFHGEHVANRDWLQDVERSLGPLGHVQFVVDVPFEGRRFADLCLTASSPAALLDDERADVARRMHALVTEDYVVSVTTDLYWTRLP